ncbi:MAG: lipoate--protein ligase [Thermovirgaceae bacterium]|nr:lipoate--protein ligase [Thermovirgaceae bacterium]
MKFLELESTDPRFNLALEEVLFNSLDEGDGFFLLWQNEPTVVVGRFQNTLEEIDASLVRKKEIHVVRRISGGGAVYHDLGNLNFSFILKMEETRDLDYREMTEPVARALQELGAGACFNSRNDLLIDGLKFSGNAQYARKGRFLHHGSILFDSDLDMLGKVLQADPDKYRSKGVKSVRSRVTNVKPFIRKGAGLDDFREAISRAAAERWPKLRKTSLEEGVRARVSALAEEKYGTWEWNYGISPDFDVRKQRRFGFGKVDVRLKVEKGIISECRIFGDFFGNGDIGNLEGSLKGIPFTREDIAGRISTLQVGHYIRGLDRQSLLEILFP